MPIPWKNSRGSITLVALSLAVVIGISLASYMALCQQAQMLSTRTVQLSRARQLAETGLEEALWALNAAANPDNTVATTAWNSTTTPTLPATTVPWDSNAPLTSDDKHCFIDGYTLGEGATGSVDITIKNFTGPIPTTTPPYQTPIIIATATVTVSGSVFTKTLTATTKPAPLFTNALGIINGYNGSVIFNGGGLVDSWDSDYQVYTPLGSITPPTPNRDYNSASAATPYPGTIPASLFTSPSLPSPYAIAIPASCTYPNLTFNYAAVVAAPNITLNGAEIRGCVATFGNPITIKSGSGGSKVSAPPPPPGTPTGASNVDPTRVSKSAFVPSFMVAEPTGFSGNLSAVYNLGPAAILSGVWYAPLGLEVDGTSGGALTISQSTVIIVQGDLYLHHGGIISIIPPNGRLEIFVEGNIKIGGIISSTAGFVNDTTTPANTRNEPKRLALYSTSVSPSRTFQYYTTLPFSGVMYSAAPNAKIEFLAPNPIIYGAILANDDIVFDPGTNPQIHYDTALQYLPRGWFKGITTPFIIVQVTES